MSLEILCFQICMLRQRAHRRRTCCTYQVKNLNTVIFPSFGLSFQYFFGQHHCSVVDPYLDPFWICIQQLSGSVYGIQIRIHTWLKLGCPNFGYKQISLRSETKGNRNSFVSHLSGHKSGIFFGSLPMVDLGEPKPIIIQGKISGTRL